MAEPLDKTLTEEAILLEKLGRIEENSSGYFAVHLHLSQLRQSNRQTHFIRMAMRTFDNLVGGADTVVYSMMNSDIILVCREVLVEDIDPYIEKVRALFSEDPLTDVDDDSFEDHFSTWYDLATPEDFAGFFSVVTELAVEADKILAERTKMKADQAAQNVGDPLSAKNLAALNQKLQGTRIADLIRQQACVRIAPAKAGAVIFREHFIAVSELKDRISPNVNLFSSVWLFQFLTETLDKRLLAVMGRKSFPQLKEPISLNLNVGTVLSRDFAQFNRVVGDFAEKVIIEMQVIDIFSDMGSFGYARDMLQDRGYRVVVDGLTPLALQFFDPSHLKTDFLKVTWTKELEDVNDKHRLESLRETVQLCGKDSIILARVDSEKAVKIGMALGVSRFQGYFIDKLVQAMGQSKIRPTAKPKVKSA